MTAEKLRGKIIETAKKKALRSALTDLLHAVRTGEYMASKSRTMPIAKIMPAVRKALEKARRTFKFSNLDREGLPV
jgi:antitoxin (DNA-binding transcriptional repressor) of toxin-antitoxin stability system